MTPGNENSGKKLVWEVPQLMRLTAPGDATAACGGPGSGQAGDCVRSGATATVECYAAGSSAFGTCVGAGSGPA